MINCVGCARTSCLRLAYREATPLLQPRAFSFRRRHQPFATSCSASMAGVKAVHNKDKVIVISGPTGAGKSRLALELAKQLNGEIISADSIQVYRGLDIGSAKPSLSERQEVPHHLIDILHPSEEYSAGQFFEDARQATRDVLNRGRVPIVTGGTGLYLRWFIYGKPDVPKASREVSSGVCSELARLQRLDHWNEAVQLVVEAGDPRAQAIPTNNWYRLRRSLEIIKSSGQPPSAFQVPYHSFNEQFASQLVDHSIDTKSCEADLEESKPLELDYNFSCFFLSTQRLDLYRSIDFRCEDMLSGPDGIMSEARWLLDNGLLPNSNPATRAIGYRQAMEFMLRCQAQGGGSSAKDFLYFLSDFQKASRNFAKRQLTWFRNEHIYQWIDASRPLEQVLKFMIEAHHDQSGSPPTVPDSLSMKRVSDHREARQLKAYRTRNRVFIGRDDCSGILDWVSRTQGQTIQSVS